MRAFVRDERDLDLSLRYALLVYGNDERAYVTVHPVGRVKNRLQIGAGTPASRAALAGLSRSISNAATMSGFLPANLLYLSPRVMSWWCPPVERRVWFEVNEALDKGRIGERSARVPHPGLVFTVTARNWFVHAVAGDARPAPETTLRRAPYFNVWSTGRICTGNVKLPESMSPAVTADYERAFFDSRFTHPNDPKGLTNYKGGAFQLWIDLLDGRHATFPEASLTPARTTLAELVQKLETEK